MVQFLVRIAVEETKRLVLLSDLFYQGQTYLKHSVVFIAVTFRSVY